MQSEAAQDETTTAQAIQGVLVIYFSFLVWRFLQAICLKPLAQSLHALNMQAATMCCETLNVCTCVRVKPRRDTRYTVP